MIPKSAANFSAICLVMQSKYKQNSVRVCVCVRMVSSLEFEGWHKGELAGQGRGGQRRAGQGRLSWC